MKSKQPKLILAHVMVKCSSTMVMGTFRAIPLHLRQSPLATVTRRCSQLIGYSAKRRMVDAGRNYG